jgi:signal transduction histidine kinase
VETAPSRWNERALLVAFAAVALAFFAANAYTQHAMGRLDEDSNAIALNSTPSIQRLASIRTAVRHVEFLVGSLLTVGGKERAEVDAAVAHINDEANAYLTLPTFPGEKTFWRELNESIVAFDRGVERALGQREAGAVQASRASLVDVSRAADRVSAAAAAALEFNASNGRELALRIVSVRRSAEWVGYGLTTSFALVTVLAGIIVQRAVHRRRALLEASAAFQVRKAEELEQFAGRAAHDILNPVSATQLALALALKRGIADEKISELVARGVRNLDRTRAIIDGLLQFARAGAGPSPGASADVQTTVEDVVDGMRLAAEEADIELRVEAAAPCRACCSVGVLTSLVSNLAQNAMKYMGDATSRRITIRESTDDRFVHVEVEDSGPGIPPELVGDIFRPYVRGPARSKEGLGLGLATVKRLCETHGGRVGVRPVVGRGSTFWVELPCLRTGGAPQPSAGDGAAERNP